MVARVKPGEHETALGIMDLVLEAGTLLENSYTTNRDEFGKYDTNKRSREVPATEVETEQRHQQLGTQTS